MSKKYFNKWIGKLVLVVCCEGAEYAGTLMEVNKYGVMIDLARFVIWDNIISIKYDDDGVMI